MTKPTILLALALTASCVAAAREAGYLRVLPASPPRAGQADLTVLTYNLNFGVAGDPSTLDAIEASAADLVLLQETNAPWEDALRERLAPRYEHMRFGHPERMPAGGLAVLSRWPFEVTHVSPSDGGFFFAWRVVVHAPGGDLQALNVHLRPQVTDDGSFVRGHFATGHLRRREMTRHAATLAGGMPTIIAGDFNEADEGDAVALARGLGMTSALGMFDRDATTWRWPIGPFTLRQRLDHVMFSTGAFECLHARVMVAGASDHLPVVARLRRAR